MTRGRDARLGPSSSRSACAYVHATGAHSHSQVQPSDFRAVSIEEVGNYAVVGRTGNLILRAAKMAALHAGRISACGKRPGCDMITPLTTVRR